MTAKSAKPAPFLERTPILEWVTAAIGLVLVIAAIGYLTLEGLRADEQSPRLSVQARAVTATKLGYTVAIEVRNESRVTASGVQVVGRLSTGDTSGEEVSLTFDYVAGMGRRTGSMTFLNDPRKGGLSLTARGQVDP